MSRTRENVALVLDLLARYEQAHAEIIGLAECVRIMVEDARQTGYCQGFSAGCRAGFDTALANMEPGRK